MPAQKGTDARRAGRLILCSYGLNVNQMTLETLAALRECDAVYSEALSDGSRLYLENFCPTIEPLNQRDADDIVEFLLSQVGSGRRVAYLTYGDPMVWNERCSRLVSRCDADHLDYRVYRGISYLNELLGVLRLAAADAIGVYVRDIGKTAAGFRLDVPALVFGFGNRSKSLDVDRFIAGVQRLYPGGHGLEVLNSVYADPAVLQRQNYRVRNLRRAWKEADPESTLYIPAVARRRAGSRGRKKLPRAES